MRRISSVLVLLAAVTLVSCDKEPEPLPDCIEHLACLSECTVAEGGPSIDAQTRCAEQCPANFTDTSEAFFKGFSALSATDSAICGGAPADCPAWMENQRPRINALLEQTAVCLRQAQNTR